jgi:hypothetical protein
LYIEVLKLQIETCNWTSNRYGTLVFKIEDSVRSDYVQKSEILLDRRITKENVNCIPLNAFIRQYNNSKFKVYSGGVIENHLNLLKIEIKWQYHNFM